MSKGKANGVGLVILLVVVVVILFLVARASMETVPIAVEAAKGSDTPSAVPDHGQSEAVDALGELPDLDEMRSSTGEHAKAVSEALEATE
jgi:hypothetical protein